MRRLSPPCPTGPHYPAHTCAASPTTSLPLRPGLSQGAAPCSWTTYSVQGPDHADSCRPHTPMRWAHGEPRSLGGNKAQRSVVSGHTAAGTRHAAV